MHALQALVFFLMKKISMYLCKEELCEQEDEEEKEKGGKRLLDRSLDKNTLGSYWGKTYVVRNLVRLSLMREKEKKSKSVVFPCSVLSGPSLPS